MTIFLFFHSIPNVDVLQVDVTNEAHIAKAAEHVKQKYGKLELLVNNAGLLHPSGLGSRFLWFLKIKIIHSFSKLQLRLTISKTTYFHN